MASRVPLQSRDETAQDLLRTAFAVDVGADGERWLDDDARCPAWPSEASLNHTRCSGSAGSSPSATISAAGGLMCTKGPPRTDTVPPAWMRRSFWAVTWMVGPSSVMVAPPVESVIRRAKRSSTRAPLRARLAA